MEDEKRKVFVLDGQQLKRDAVAARSALVSYQEYDAVRVIPRSGMCAMDFDIGALSNVDMKVAPIEGNKMEVTLTLEVDLSYERED